MLQQWAVGLIVAGSAGYAAWTLMPAAWRRALSRRLGRTPASTGGCGGCDGCGSPAPPPGTPQAIRIVRRQG